MDSLLRTAFAEVVKRGQLKVTTARGDVMEFGDRTGPPVAVRFTDTAAQLLFLADPDPQLGKLFMDGRFIVDDGTIYDFLYVTLRDSKNLKAPLLMRSVDWLRQAMIGVNTHNFSARSKRNVAHHYDLDARLYRLFLDADMQYSCAYFETPEQSLEDAQLAKKRHIAAKLLVEPGNRILDIGCGWGGMALYLAEIAGAGSVKGITLSEEQLEIANKRKIKSTSSSALDFALEDYRNTTGRFDRIASVGMFEHVGRRFYNTFFEACHKLLDDQGVMLLHTIGCSDGPGYTTPWLTKYIFPGGYIPSLSEIIPCAERAGLTVRDIEVLNLHYALTLNAWRTRFLARRDEARQLYDERFCRMWEFYLASGEAAFRCEGLVVFQLQISKSPDVVPMTRDYIQAREQGLRRRESEVMRSGDIDKTQKA
jgi:cyclopropane-fatty-acyl-phospholipid synthase